MKCVNGYEVIFLDPHQHVRFKGRRREHLHQSQIGALMKVSGGSALSKGTRPRWRRHCPKGWSADSVMVCLIRTPPNHLQSSLTLSAYTPVSLRCTLHKLAQPRHSCGWTKLGSMSNFPGLSPYVSGCRLFVFFSICRICLMHFH